MGKASDPERVLALEAKTLLATWNPRTALAIVPVSEAPAFLAALNPFNEEDLHELVQRAIPRPTWARSPRDAGGRRDLRRARRPRPLAR